MLLLGDVLAFWFDHLGTVFSFWTRVQTRSTCWNNFSTKRWSPRLTLKKIHIVIFYTRRPQSERRTYWIHGPAKESMSAWWAWRQHSSPMPWEHWFVWGRSKNRSLSRTTNAFKGLLALWQYKEVFTLGYFGSFCVQLLLAPLQPVGFWGFQRYSNPLPKIHNHRCFLALQGFNNFLLKAPAFLGQPESGPSQTNVPLSHNKHIDRVQRVCKLYSWSRWPKILLGWKSLPYPHLFGISQCLHLQGAMLPGFSFLISFEEVTEEVMPRTSSLSGPTDIEVDHFS